MPVKRVLPFSGPRSGLNNICSTSRQSQLSMNLLRAIPGQHEAAYAAERGCPSHLPAPRRGLGLLFGLDAPSAMVTERTILDRAAIATEMQHAICDCICRRRGKSKSSERVQGMFKMNASV